MSIINRRQAGFTIVELLIVIVVIAILATISIVAYNGIQNRVNDAAVQSDISNYAKKIMVYYVEHEVYPAGNGGISPAGIGKFPLARGSYRTDVHNFYYCEGVISGKQEFAVGAESKSGNEYYYASFNGGVRPYAGSWSGGMVGICTGMLPGVEAGYTRTYGYDVTAQTWFAWTQ